MPKGHKNLYPSIPNLCYCGCKEIVWNGRKYLPGHNSRCRTEETKRKLSEHHIDVSGNKNPNWGKHWSDEIKKKIGDAERGWHHTEEAKVKISKGNKKPKPWMRGDKSPAKRLEVRAKFSKLRKGKINLGARNGNWNNGTSFLPYCYKFNSRLKEEIRKRDNYQCQNPSCLITQLESLILYGKSLYIHHIHYDKENCDPNLITLCIGCNTRANKNRNYWEQLYIKILKERNLLNWKPMENKL